MPIIVENGEMPPWCELRRFEIVRLEGDERVYFAREGMKEKLIIAEGGCEVRVGGRSFTASKGEQFNSGLQAESFEVLNAEIGTVVMRLCGSWGNTKFDRHYHDCDEYYILYEGEGNGGLWNLRNACDNGT